MDETCIHGVLVTEDRRRHNRDGCTGCLKEALLAPRELTPAERDGMYAIIEEVEQRRRDEKRSE
jgi:hypothetical protein